MYEGDCLTDSFCRSKRYLGGQTPGVLAKVKLPAAL